jgi:hypothetical protein
MDNPPLRKAARTIGWLVLIIGVMLFSGSLGMQGMGNKARARYESGGGKFLRSISAEDASYYRYLRMVLVLAKIMRPLGLIGIVAGTVIVRKPEWLEEKLNPPVSG